MAHPSYACISHAEQDAYGEFASDDLARMRYVPCEHCHGTGEIEMRPTVGPYEDPTPHAALCSACEGYGMECVETDDAGIEHTEQPESE